MAAAHLLHPVEVAVGRWQHAARADHRLVDERGDVLGPHARDLVLERGYRVPGDLGGLLDQPAELLAVGQAEDARSDPVGGW